MSIEKVRLLILDVDGVLTDGGIYLDAEGRELKRFNVHDGTGIKWAMRAGLTVAIISGRDSAVVKARAKELGIEHVHVGAKIKLDAYDALMQGLPFNDSEVCYIGDDCPDLPVMRRVGYAVAVPNARDEVKQAAAHVTTSPGGSGAVRELVELILRSQGKWAGIMERYL